MTKRTEHGYAHPNAYREWLPEHGDVLKALSLKHRSVSALQSTVPIETLSVVLGRSVTSIAHRAALLEVCILNQEQIQGMVDEQERSARDFINRTF